MSSVVLIRQLVEQIKSFDELEEKHRLSALCWIESGMPLFRIQKPNIPDQHLVSYFVVIDKAARKVLLIDHKKSGLWLPTGGHVEIDEDPHQTVIRECAEELGVAAKFWDEAPFFITVTQTNDIVGSHTDVSLWYVLEGSYEAIYSYDQTEFNTIGWFNFDGLPLGRTDPHMARFISKLDFCLHQKTA